jgi:hypothetical protein
MILRRPTRAPISGPPGEFLNVPIRRASKEGLTYRRTCWEWWQNNRLFEQAIRPASGCSEELVRLAFIISSLKSQSNTNQLERESRGDSLCRSPFERAIQEFGDKAEPKHMWSFVEFSPSLQACQKDLNSYFRGQNEQRLYTSRRR